MGNKSISQSPVNHSSGTQSLFEHSSFLQK